MKNAGTYIALISCMLFAGFTGAVCAGQTWDLSADFSLASNPGPDGVWSYGAVNSTADGFSELFTLYNNSYPELGCPGWMSANPNTWWVGLGKSTGNAGTYDFPAGRVGGHAPTGVRWTAPRDMAISITGAVWMIREPTFGRRDGVTLSVNGVKLINNVEIPQRSAGVTSGNPFALAQAITAGGGQADSLSSIPVRQGESVWVGISYITQYDFVGIDLTITEVQGGEDAAFDWSETVNPSGAWAYGTVDAAFTDFIPFSSHTTLTGADWNSSGQPAWFSPEYGAHIEKSNGSSVYDLPAGRIGGYTPADGGRYLAIKWTSPGKRVVNICGDLWRLRTADKPQVVSLLVKGRVVIDRVLIGDRNAGHTSSNPYRLADAAVDGGADANDLLYIPVDAGDSIVLAVQPLDGRGPDYVGLDLVVRTVLGDTIPISDLAPVTVNVGPEKIFRNKDGIRVNGSAELSYQLSYMCDSLACSVGVDAAADPAAEVTFQIYADTVKVFDSGVMRKGDPFKQVNVSLQNVRILKLKTVAGAAADSFGLWMNPNTMPMELGEPDIGGGRPLRRAISANSGRMPEEPEFLNPGGYESSWGNYASRSIGGQYLPSWLYYSGELYFFSQEPLDILLGGSVVPRNGGDVYGMGFKWMKTLEPGYEYEFHLGFNNVPDIITVDNNIVWDISTGYVKLFSTSESSWGGSGRPSFEVVFHYVPQTASEGMIWCIRNGTRYEPDSALKFCDAVPQFSATRVSLGGAAPPTYDTLAPPYQVSQTPQLYKLYDSEMRQWQQYDKLPIKKPDYPTENFVILEQGAAVTETGWSRPGFLGSYAHPYGFLHMLGDNGIHGMMTNIVLPSNPGQSLANDLSVIEDGLNYFYIDVPNQGGWMDIQYRIAHGLPYQLWGFPPATQIEDLAQWDTINYMVQSFPGATTSALVGGELEHVQYLTFPLANASNHFDLVRKAYIQMPQDWNAALRQNIDNPAAVPFYEQSIGAAYQTAYLLKSYDMSMSKDWSRQNIEINIANNRGACRSYGKPMMLADDPWTGNLFTTRSPDETEQIMYLAYFSGVDYLYHEYNAFVQKVDGRFPNAWGEKYLDFARFAAVHPRRGNQIVRIAVMRGFGDIWSKIYAENTPGLANSISFDPTIADYNLLNTFLPSYGTYYQSNPYRFCTGTPFGPVDMVPWDAPLSHLSIYDLVVYMGQNAMDSQQYQTLKAYVQQGGKLVMSLGQLRVEGNDPRPVLNEALNDPFLGVALQSMPSIAATQAEITFQTGSGSQAGTVYDLYTITPTTAQTIASTTDGRPVVVKNSYGSGAVYLYATDFLSKVSFEPTMSFLAAQSEPSKMLTFQPFSDWLEYTVWRNGQSYILPIFNHGRIRFPSGVGPDQGVWQGQVTLGYDKFPDLQNVDVEAYRVDFTDPEMELTEIPVIKGPNGVTVTLDVDKRIEIVVGPRGTARSDFFCGQPPAPAVNTDTSWDLAADWSDDSNPADNGVWAYIYSNVGQRFPIRLSNYDATNFYSGQTAWSWDPAVTTPAMLKSRGLAKSMDLPSGRVTGYPAFTVRWTAPRNVIVNLSGGVWYPRELGGKGNKITLSKKINGVETVLFSASVKRRSQGYTSARPYAFSQAASDNAASPDVLQNIALNRGDSIILRAAADPTSFGPDFLGVDFTVTAAQLDATLAQIKNLPDGTSAGCSRAVVTAAFDGYFYVESDDRSAGIRVNLAGHNLKTGDRADIVGTVRTDGERYIDAVAAVKSGSGSIDPIGFKGRDLGTSGLNNVGLLVKVWGLVSHINPTRFAVDDGSGELIVQVQSPSDLPAAGSYVTVTGISSCEKVGDQALRLLRARYTDAAPDIVEMYAAPAP
ncbi:MAG: NPCBM/NEW2 domain-containing protein [Armatimonadetes bacterium]|nr:NPCBM/NEW2 domain-containing protein [Armatimonadota bacterium]